MRIVLVSNILARSVLNPDGPAMTFCEPRGIRIMDDLDLLELLREIESQ